MTIPSLYRKRRYIDAPKHTKTRARAAHEIFVPSRLYPDINSATVIIDLVGNAAAAVRLRNGLGRLEEVRDATTFVRKP